ncbi:MAG: tripartite tricarboxylate transporter TctB family protein [Chloroflexota bacterium]
MKWSGSAILTALVVLVMALALFEARNFPFGGRLYPMVAGGMTFILSLSALIREIRRMRAGTSLETGKGATMDLGAGDGEMRERLGGIARIGAWVLCLSLGIWLLGWLIGVSAFFVSYLVFKAHARWFAAIGLTALMVLLLLSFDRVLDVFWPEGLLVQWLDLPLF